MPKGTTSTRAMRGKVNQALAKTKNGIVAQLIDHARRAWVWPAPQSGADTYGRPLWGRWHNTWGKPRWGFVGVNGYG